MRKEKKPVNRANRRPLTEEEIARRRKKRKLLEQRKKKQRQKAMILLFAVIILVGVVFGLSKCSTDRFTESDSTTLTLTSSGEVVFEEIIERDEDMAEKELHDFVQSEIDGFKSDDKAIKIEKVKVKRDESGINRAYLRLRYKDVATYSAFTGYDCFYGTISEAMGKGYSFTASFVTPEGGEILREEAISDSAASVFIIQENVNIAYPGEIKYLSSEGTKLESGLVRISSVDGNTDSAPLTYLIFANDKAKGE